MPKKPTKANIKKAAEASITYHGGISEAITSFEGARELAKQVKDTRAVHTYNRLIKYCEARRLATAT